MINKDQYVAIAECIRGDQVSAPEVVELFEDGKFLKWYKKNMILIQIEMKHLKKNGWRDIINGKEKVKKNDVHTTNL